MATTDTTGTMVTDSTGTMSSDSTVTVTTDYDVQSLQESLGLQISEIEMLLSMYPEDNDIIFDDPLAKRDIESFLDGKMNYEYLTARNGFCIHIIIEKTVIELVCRLSHDYPNVPPVIILRCESLHRSILRRLCDNLQKSVQSLPSGELYLCPIIDWLQENAPQYIEENQIITPGHVTAVVADPRREVTFTRMWIYSHHIYSKIKRKDILDYSSELRLSGFSMPGKPGIIVIEGLDDDVEEFWYRIRSMNWKRLVMKEKTQETCAYADVEMHRKFEGFQEKSFEPRGGKGREYHMDLGMLLEFLKESGFEDKFKLYFGVEGT